MIVLKIRELRKAKKMTMKELGEVLGVAESTVSLYELGKREPDFETLRKIADYFNVSLDYLLGRDEYPISEEEWKNTPVALSSPEGYDALTDEGKRQIMELIKILPKKTDK